MLVIAHLLDCIGPESESSHRITLICFYFYGNVNVKPMLFHVIVLLSPSLYSLQVYMTTSTLGSQHSDLCTLCFLETLMH